MKSTMGSSGQVVANGLPRRPLAVRVRDRLKYSAESFYNKDRSLQRELRSDVAFASHFRAQRPQNKRHLLVPPKGMGNIGDQAMLEAFLRSTASPVTILLEVGGALDIPADLRDRAEVVVIPDLFAARPWIRRKVRRTLAPLIAQHSSLSILGADVMDGSLSRAESVVRWSMLCMSNAIGTPCRVLGFSWHSAKPPVCVQHALLKSQPQALLCARDPHSYARIREQGGRNVRQAADTVFALEEATPYVKAESWTLEQSGRPIVIVNVSGIIARRGIGSRDYIQIVQYLLDSERSVLILPHVIRTGDSDLDASRDVVSAFSSNPHVFFVDELLTPGNVAWLAQCASAVVTGRMHLSILALNQGIPAVILATQGKVSGLLEMFDLPGLEVQPVSGFATDVIKALDVVFSDEPAIRSHLQMRLPGVRKLAWLNFAGLEDVGLEDAASTTQRG